MTPSLEISQSTLTHAHQFILALSLDTLVHCAVRAVAALLPLLNERFVGIREGYE